LSLELFVELSQCLLLKDDILMIESRLLPVAIRFFLLFLHLLFHVGKHLKELISVLLRWLDTDGYPLRRGTGVFGGMRLIDGWWRDRTPSGADGIAFGCCAIDGDNLLFWSH